MPETAPPPPTLVTRVTRRLPGLGIAIAIAAVSSVIGMFLPVVGSAVPAVLIGLLVGAIVRPGARLKPGIAFAGKFVLQLSVVVLGTQLSIDEVARVGLGSLPVMLGTLAICLVAAWAFGTWLGVVGDVRTLIGVGTGVCGASAIAATAPVIGAISADVAYAISTIFLFNVAAVLVFPVVGHLLGMSQSSFGLFAGTAVNDTSSVVAAATTYGQEAANEAVVVKLVRTLMIIPIVLVLAGVVAGRRPPAREDPAALAPAAAPAPARPSLRRLFRLVPWFLVGFVLAALVNSAGLIPTAVHPALNSLSLALISTALAGIGLSTDVAALRSAGWRPLLLGGLLWLTVALSSLGLQWLTGGL